MSPLGYAYATAGLLRGALARPRRVAAPVICVGNLVAGGAGKTPTALAIGDWLKGRRRTFHFLTRGYGGKLAGPVAVQPDRHDAGAVGDEALLLAARAPTWVARDRAAGAMAAVAAGAEVVVMDDGHQNPSLYKDISVVVIDSGYMFGNGRIIPAGPLREPIARGLARADAVVAVDDPGLVRRLDALCDFRGPVLRARLAPTAAAYRLIDVPVVAFAGIARPAKFFATLQAVGARLLSCHDFADHHVFSPEEIIGLVDVAQAAGARLVTTTKDAARLPREARTMVEVLEVDLEFDVAAALDGLLAPLFGDRQ
jgi:tetraacyldisaccharide 4'-kinase